MFSEFYSANSLPSAKTSCHLLSLIPESVTVPATLKRVINVICNIIGKVNPGQILTVITGNHPVYAPRKQWVYTDTFATASFWFAVIEREKALFKLIRSSRQTYSNLVTQSFEYMLCCMAALDQTHYLRWR